MSAESEGDVAAELETNCNLGKTMASVCPAWRCPHQVGLDIFRKITYHRPQNSVCFGEILQFRQRSLVPPVFQNELGKAGMAHMNLGWANLKPWDLCLPDKELS